MQGKDFLVIAKNFCGSQNEAERRTAISRAYYAIYNHVQSCLRPYDIQITRSHIGHEQIYRYLHNSGMEDVQDIAATFNSLRTIRNDADYDLQASRFDNNTCKLNLKRAELLLDQFDNINLKILTDGIKKYKTVVRE